MKGRFPGDEKPAWHQKYRAVLYTQLSETLTVEEAALLSKMLQHPVLVKAMAILYMPARTMPMKLAALALSTQEAVVQASQIQG